MDAIVIVVGNIEITVGRYSHVHWKVELSIACAISAKGYAATAKKIQYAAMPSIGDIDVVVALINRHALRVGKLPRSY